MNAHPAQQPALHTVLIVDDVADVRRELSSLLSLSGDIAVVGEAEDGQEAIRLAEALHPEVVLMDLELPIMNGCEAACRIKLLLPACRVIALTIHDDEQSREKCSQAGMDAFITKGACVDALLQSIRRSGGIRSEGDSQ